MEQILNSSTILTHTGDVSLLGLMLNILFAAILLTILGLFYVKYGTSLTNRNHLAKNFVLIGVTTTLVITVVKASLALSLGLVGALSIVRFRAAIKEPEELGFIFLAIAIGLGFGADKGSLTLVAFAVILVLFLLHKRVMKHTTQKDNLYISVEIPDNNKDSYDAVLKSINLNLHEATLKRFDKKGIGMDLVFMVNINSYDELEDFRRDIDVIDDIKYSIVEEAKIF